MTVSFMGTPRHPTLATAPPSMQVVTPPRPPSTPGSKVGGESPAPPPWLAGAGAGDAGGQFGDEEALLLSAGRSRTRLGDGAEMGGMAGELGRGEGGGGGGGEGEGGGEEDRGRSATPLASRKKMFGDVDASEEEVRRPGSQGKSPFGRAGGASVAMHLQAAAFMAGDESAFYASDDEAPRPPCAAGRDSLARGPGVPAVDSTAGVGGGSVSAPDVVESMPAPDVVDSMHAPAVAHSSGSEEGRGGLSEARDEQGEGHSNGSNGWVGGGGRVEGHAQASEEEARAATTKTAVAHQGEAHGEGREEETTALTRRIRSHLSKTKVTREDAPTPGPDANGPGNGQGSGLATGDDGGVRQGDGGEAPPPPPAKTHAPVEHDEGAGDGVAAAEARAPGADALGVQAHGAKDEGASGERAHAVEAEAAGANAASTHTADGQGAGGVGGSSNGAEGQQQAVVASNGPNGPLNGRNGPRSGPGDGADDGASVATDQRPTAAAKRKPRKKK